MARVLVVEDETQILTLAESVLQKAGHETRSAATVAEAQAIIHSDETFDLVFADIQLGNHNEGGIIVGTLIAQARPGTPVLYTSGSTTIDAVQSLFIDCNAFLPKPYTAKQLTDAVGKLLSASHS